MSKRYKSTWHKMRELVILSLNVIYIKDLLQFYERAKFKTEYLNLSVGPYEVLINNALHRKHELNRRIKIFLEELLNSDLQYSNYCFNIELPHACITRKQMEKGYAFFTNVFNNTYALNLRSGTLLLIDNPELSASSDRNLMSLEHIAYHEGSIYKYFEIDLSDPITNNIRY